MTVRVTATTGASFELKLPRSGTVDELRWQVARKLQLPRDRLTIIHRERYLCLIEPSFRPLSLETMSKPNLASFARISWLTL